MRCSCCQTILIRNYTLREIFITGSFRCFHCEKYFSKIDPASACAGCGRPDISGLCHECQQWEKEVGFVLNNKALFSYTEGFKEWITAYKFKGDYRLRGAFATELQQSLKAYRQYIICPMPLSAERFSSRGFNQVSGCLAIMGCSHQLLLGRQETPPQSEKTRVARLNMPQVFYLIQPAEKIRNQKVLLVDDVYTTGRTLLHGAELLYKNGAKVVNSLTFAR